MKKIKKLVVFAVIIAIAAGGVFIVKSKLSSNQKGKPSQANASKTAVNVQTAKETPKNLGDTYKATFEASKQGTVTSKLSAKIVSVTVENGQYVNEGDTIATLDDQDIQNNIKTAQAQLEVTQKQLDASNQQLNSAQVSMEKLKINLDDAQSNYDREKTLFESNAISQVELQTAEKTLNSAKADYDSGNASIQTATANVATAQANIDVQKTNLSKSQSDLNSTVIKAPISGVISNKNMTVGQMASSNTALAMVNDISSVYATIQIPQEKINTAKIGQETKVSIAGNDQAYDGNIEYIDATADPTSRVFNCKIKLTNSDKSLFPGIYGKVTLINDQSENVITVPVNSLTGSNGNYYIFINDNGKAKKQRLP